MLGKIEHMVAVRAHFEDKYEDVYELYEDSLVMGRQINDVEDARSKQQSRKLCWGLA
jgi:hypothetical protein